MLDRRYAFQALHEKVSEKSPTGRAMITITPRAKAKEMTMNMSRCGRRPEFLTE